GGGYGHDFADNHNYLDEDGNYLNSSNSIQFTAEVDPTSVEYSRDLDTLYIVLNNGDDVLTVDGAFGFDGQNMLDKLIFTYGEGSVINFVDIKDGIPSITIYQPTEEGDWLPATENDDVLEGLAGHDEIEGYTGNDSLYGGAGDDYLDGGFGN